MFFMHLMYKLYANQQDPIKVGATVYVKGVNLCRNKKKSEIFII